MSNVRICAMNYLDDDLINARSVSSENASYPDDNLYDDNRRSKVWRSTGDSAEWIKWDFGTAYNPKAFILMGLRDSAIALTASSVITLEGNETDSWGSPTYSQVIAYDENAIAIFDIDGLHTGALRWWRVTFADATNPNGYIEIASAYLGEMFEATRGAAQFPFSGEIYDTTVTQYSEDGQSYSDIGSQGERYAIDWFGLTIAEKEELDTIFARIGTGRQFFISFDPDTVLSSAESNYIKLVKLTSSFGYQLVSPGNFSAAMAFREET